MKLWSTALCTPPSFTPRHRPIYRCSASRAQRVPAKKDPGASSSRRGGGGGGGLVPAPEIKFEIDLSIAVKIGREIRWPMVIERGGEVARERIRCETTLRYAAERQRERESEEGEAEDRRRDRGQEEWWRKCIVGDILPVYGPRHAGARCSDAHNGRDVHLPQEPIIRYGGRSLYVPPLSLARIAYGPPANSFLSNPISPPSVSPFCSPSPY